jgi:hypothetical protein
MSRGDAYRRIHLIDASGKEVERPFLELGEELWDPDGKRFTLFFDPGRIKHDLKPRLDLGPAIEAGKSYALVIDSVWEDAEGFPLKETYRKNFRVTAPDEQPIDPKAWKLQAPAAGKAEPLRVVFPEPLDHAMLHRVLWIVDAKGQKVAGKIKVSDEETVWQFTPDQPWQEGAYQLVADVWLEDLAGNKIGRNFEVDVFEKIDREVKVQTAELPFEVRPASGPAAKP